VGTRIATNFLNVPPFAVNVAPVLWHSQSFGFGACCEPAVPEATATAAVESARTVIVRSFFTE
jgi:hypothetical protein